MTIEANRVTMESLPVDVQLLRKLRETARLLSTHYSTQIEGNRLTEAQVREAVQGHHLSGRECDETEVRHYYAALHEAEQIAQRSGLFTEQDIQTLHGLVMYGQPKPSAYRDAQNVIRDSATRTMIYLPPEAADVPALMRDMVQWINDQIARHDLPFPLVAAIAHYQFATIHPYIDGNGRVARLLATLLLHKNGYVLKGIYSLEEYYARNLQDYYMALARGESHNYYFGREAADITPFLEYFCDGMAAAFAAVRQRATEIQAQGGVDLSQALRQLGPRKRRALELFRQSPQVSAADLAQHLRLSEITMRRLCRTWVADRFLRIYDASRKNRLYALGEQFTGLS